MPATGGGYAEANRFQRAMRRSGGTRAGSWLYIRVLHRIDQPVFRMTDGRHTFTSLLTGLPIGVLRTTGARSGQPRHSPLLIYPTAAGELVIASNYGQARHPDWYHNLVANPAATLRWVEASAGSAPGSSRVRRVTGSGGRRC